MRKSFKLIKIEMNPTLPFKDDTFAKEIDTCRQEWKALETEVSKYLPFCRQKFVWGIGIDRKIFLHTV